MTAQIVLASENRKKIAELETLFAENTSIDVSVRTLRDVGHAEPIAETGASFEENALIKARVAASYGCVGVADDSGLEVDFLNGEPGIYSARYASLDGATDASDAANNKKLLEKLSGVPFDSRRAHFTCSIACCFPNGSAPLSGVEFTVRGKVDGVILDAPRGESGFGYDPLFLYEPADKTFAELEAAQKNRISHRADAMRKFMAKFTEMIKGANQC